MDCKYQIHATLRTATFDYKNVHELKNQLLIIELKKMATSLYNSDKYPRFHAQFFPQRLGVFLSVTFVLHIKKAPVIGALFSESV